ncbi:MAG: alpha-glucan family phosphorylase, partial [Gemmatimonadota bacterium]|nr:alpha-glucan family phosphorylase [Gemmatimonadota bacterium]
RAAADLEVPMIAVTLLHRKGYFTQTLDPSGQQHESEVVWSPEKVLAPESARASVEISGRRVEIRAWRYDVRGANGHIVPVFLLDTKLEENSEWDRTLTDCLYGGDSHYRLCQEVVLGMGGAAMLEALGYADDALYHMNEGHAALITLTLLERELAGRARHDIGEADLERVRRRCIFTTHTPVPAGHDKFNEGEFRSVLGDERAQLLIDAHVVEDHTLNMTHLALRLSRYVNAVAMRHREISQGMFPDYPIDSITNGVHATTWTAAPFQALFDRRIPEWRRDNQYLRYAIDIPLEEILDAHAEAKAELFAEVHRRTGVKLDPAVMTIGFARRATPYKRADLIFSDIKRLKAITERSGKIQLIFGGKAHPRDEGGKSLIKQIYAAAASLPESVRVVYVENYEMDIAHLMTSGVDLWLNNPTKPLEASGTSGMKAALNGVPSYSVLDGWWVEGCIDGVTGWSIGAAQSDEEEEIADLYVKLERVILPLFYGLPFSWAKVMRNSIALNGSFFNTQRMVGQYVHNAYFPPKNQRPIPVAAAENAKEDVQSAWAGVS